MLLNNLPQRIISLVPSQTELLFDLGLEERVVGITKFCIHPKKWYRTKNRIGGTKNLHIEKIKALQPDLIIANKEENEKSQVEALANLCPIYVSEISDLQGACEMITTVGKLTGTVEKAEQLKKNVTQEFSLLAPKHTTPLKVAYLIWKDPWMSVGGDTFIHDMISNIGWQNIFADNVRYPIIDIETILARNADIILLSSEPYPFTERHIDELQQHLSSKTKIVLVDGEMFSWYGSRLLLAPRYFRELCIKISSYFE